MTILIDIGLSLAALLLLIPSLVLFIECSAALLPRRRDHQSEQSARPGVHVLIPAHDEAGVIRHAIESIRPQLEAGDGVLVVADNCRDDTAAVARQAGAEVVVRDEPERRGKGFALEHGLGHLATDSPQVVVVMDADCVARDGTLDAMARSAVRLQRPVQARYIFEPPAQPGPMDWISAFACLVKNVVRPTGLHHLGLPCPLTGSGMAFPWSVIKEVNWTGDHLVEDMQLGLDCALSGHPPSLCLDAVVTTHLPKHRGIQTEQRRRWEHGHLGTILSQVPKLVSASVRMGRFDLAAMALDLCVPPLSLLVMLTLAILGLSTGMGLLGCSWSPAYLASVGLGLVVVAMVQAWIGFGRGNYPLKPFLRLPLYVLRKRSLYSGFLFHRQKSWVRTRREDGPGQKDDDR